jgi:hypothetical protein
MISAGGHTVAMLWRRRLPCPARVARIMYTHFVHGFLKGTNPGDVFSRFDTVFWILRKYHGSSAIPANS